MLWSDFFNGFQLHNNQSIADQIRFIDLLQWLTFIKQVEFLLRYIRNALFSQLFLQALLINCFEETTPHFTIYFKDGSLNLVALILKKNFFVAFVFFVVHIILPVAAR